MERKLYPNVDFYSSIIIRALGIPVEMFTVILRLGACRGGSPITRRLPTIPSPASADRGEKVAKSGDVEFMRADVAAQ